MAQIPNKRAREDDWYSVSVDSLRIGGGLLFWGLVAIGLFFGYQRWSQHRVERKAFEAISKRLDRLAA